MILDFPEAAPFRAQEGQVDSAQTEAMSQKQVFGTWERACSLEPVRRLMRPVLMAPGARASGLGDRTTGYRIGNVLEIPLRRA